MPRLSDEDRRSIAAPAKTTADEEALKAQREAAFDKQYDISELLASFRPPAAPKLTEAEKLKNNRVDQVDRQIGALAGLIASFSEQTTDVEALAGALKSLQTVKHRAKRAIGGVPDEVLDPPAVERDAEGVPAEFQIGA